jgi:hypothetical protein
LLSWQEIDQHYLDPIGQLNCLIQSQNLIDHIKRLPLYFHYRWSFMRKNARLFLSGVRLKGKLQKQSRNELKPIWYVFIHSLSLSLTNTHTHSFFWKWYTQIKFTDIFFKVNTGLKNGFWYFVSKVKLKLIFVGLSLKLNYCTVFVFLC